MTWIDCGKYWHYKVKQGTDKWLEMKKGRLGGTTNNGKSEFDSKKNIGMCVAGVKNKEFNETSKEKMAYGNRKEPKARRYYEKLNKCKVIEMGFCIPKNNHNIGVSVDGMVGINGIIEIKCPYDMYPKLVNHIYSGGEGHSHIFLSHYKQMQMGMAITGTVWCDYIVYSRDRKVYIERVDFDPIFWKKLYAEIVDFWQQYVYPWCKHTKYPLPIKY